MEKTNLMEFMKNELPKADKSKGLERFLDEIINLRKKGYAVHQIKRYLDLTYKYSVSITTLGTFIRYHEKSTNF